MRLLVALALSIAVVVCSPVFAISASIKEIPEVLQPWQAWVQSDIQSLQCPNINRLPFANHANHICAWNSSLLIDLTDKGGVFSQRWRVLKDDTWVALPGDEWIWPEDVEVNNNRVAVVKHQGRPHVLLPQGEFQIQGQLRWPQMPEQLTIPAQTSLFELTINGERQDNLRVEEGALWLGSQQLSQQEANDMTVDVTRLLEDGPYLTLTTIITLQIYGQAREENLGLALPDGFAISHIEADLPTYLDSNGQMHIKALPGDWQIEINARANPQQLNIRRPTATALWPEQEIWVYAPDESLRMSKVSGPSPVDTSQAFMPSHWEELPGYLMENNASLQIVVSHRGIPAQVRNKLQLNRSLWLDFDGQNFTFQDNLSGQMIKDWRLSMPSPYLLESAQDQDGPLLVSNITEVRGIENRYPNVNVQAQGQINSTSQFDIGGWQQSFDSIHYAIQLPPSYRLLALFGADRASNTWLDKWNLWNSFVVLLITGLIASLFNKKTAVLGLITLILIYHEPGAPVMAIGIALLFVALQRQVNLARIATAANWLAKISVLGALLVSAYFVVTQLRLVVYPQLEHHQVSSDYQRNRGSASFAPQALEEQVVERSESRVAESKQKKMQADEVESIEVTGSRTKRADLLSRYQSNAALQAGAGRPDWRWNSYTARWTSPVGQGQQLHLVILTPTMYNSIRLTGLLLLLLMIVHMFTHRRTPRRPMKTGFIAYFDGWFKAEKAGSDSKVKSTLTVMLLPLMTVAALSVAAPVGAQQFPDQQLLAQLKDRLSKPPKCHPACATVQSVNVVADKKQLTLDMIVHAIEPVAISLPSSQQWRAQSVQVNDKPAQRLFMQNNKTYLLLESGVSNLVLTGGIYRQDTITIRFDERPQSIAQQLQGWEVSGVHKNRLQNRTLELVPQSDTEQAQAGTFKQRIKPFVQVQRRLYFDETWRLVTEVQRVAPEKGAINVDVALLPEEKVFSAGILVKDNKVKVAMAADEQTVIWHSNIARLNQFSWTAANSDSYIEQWRIIASPSWNLSLDGVPEVLYQFSQDDYYEFNFFPQQGETLAFSVNRPNAAEGAFLAIDNAKVRWMPGKRLAKLQLEFDYRSTKAAQHGIQLPEGYELIEALSDGRRLQLQSEQQQLVLPISPGEHHYKLVFNRADGLTMSSHFPVFDLKAPVSNLRSQMPLNGDRWLLFTSGPSIGPAIVYWGELLVFMFAALLLSKMNFSPLSLWQWLLLGLGISTNNWSIFIMVVLTFAAIHFYPRPQEKSNWRSYNLGKIGIAMLAVATLTGLVAVIPLALLSAPDMGIVGNQSNNWNLNWFSDKSAGPTSDIWVLSLPILIYKAVMLLWVMWLSFTFISWVKWGWRQLTDDGFMMAKPVIVKADNQKT